MDKVCSKCSDIVSAPSQCDEGLVKFVSAAELASDMIGEMEARRPWVKGTSARTATHFNAEEMAPSLEVGATRSLQTERLVQSEGPAFVAEACRRNLHGSLGLSPIGGGRIFLGLVNCRTVNEFLASSPWRPCKVTPTTPRTPWTFLTTS